MKCLHICNDFFGSQVHERLYEELDILGIEQIIYCPLKKYKLPKYEAYLANAHLRIIGSKPALKIHSFFFRYKIRYLFKDLITKVDLKTIDIIHATTLFSDGALALKIHEVYDIPYIVAVRATDIELFFKYKPELFWLLHKIIRNAYKLIFVSDSLVNKFLNHYFIKYNRNTIQHKCEVIYNGIDSYWLDNMKTNNRSRSPFNIVYVGRLAKEKNIIRLIEATLKLKEEFPLMKLSIIGNGEGRTAELCKKIISNHRDVVNYIGPIYDKDQLLIHYRSNGIFAMPSLRESFGLVYIEALTQGTAVLFSQGRGIDGLFKHFVGTSVDPYRIKSVTKGLKELILHYDQLEIDKIDFSIFRWNYIAGKYVDIYRNC